MRRRVAAALAIACAAGTAAAQRGNTLDIYVADTEGGKAALYVAPSGQAVLIDSGNPGERDNGRIVAMLKEAGVDRLEYLVSTHYHRDHIGGMQELARRIPIAHYVDHGPSIEEREQVEGFQSAYAELRARARHTVVKPGDRLAVAGIDFRIVTAGGEALKKPLPGGGAANAVCGRTQKQPDPPTPDENAHSVGSVITYGEFRAIDLGDLLWNEELELMCPSNPIGTVDLYMVTHHGLNTSGADALVHGVRPRVAVMQNGMRKGGTIAAYQILRASPGLEDIWQLHWSHAAGVEHNPAGVFIANVDDAATIASVLNGAQAGSGAAGAAAHSPAHYLKISARPNGSFTVTNTRNGFSKTYTKRR